MAMMIFRLSLLTVAAVVTGYAPSSRRAWLASTATTTATTFSLGIEKASADAPAMQDTLDIDAFLRTGMDTGGNMGVSSQAGKSRPITGVVFRDGSDVLQDKRSGQVSAELLTGTKANPKAVLVSFQTPFKLETGPVFDVECRDSKTGDGIFVAVTKPLPLGQSLESLPSSFFTERLFEPTGRFSFYGAPTDIKVKSSKILLGGGGETKKRWIEVQFSNLSQSTNAEIPRKALIAAMLPDGTDNIVMLVGSSNANRWGKVQDEMKSSLVSFQALAAPKTNLKLRSKQRGNEWIY